MRQTGLGALGRRRRSLRHTLGYGDARSRERPDTSLSSPYPTLKRMREAPESPMRRAHHRFLNHIYRCLYELRGVREGSWMDENVQYTYLYDSYRPAPVLYCRAMF